MKRMQLFELADQKWFPNCLRDDMRQYLHVLHQIAKSPETFMQPLKELCLQSQRLQLMDCCSGDGHLILEISQLLRQDPQLTEISIQCSDLYPPQKALQNFAQGPSWASYREDSIDVHHFQCPPNHIQTIFAAFHHFTPPQARHILQQAQEKQYPICIMEISDNSTPKWLWWLALIPAFLTTFFLMPMLRPLNLRALFFTYICPILPICIAWDGAVSNARTYSVEDLQELIQDLNHNYDWKITVLKGAAPGNMLSLIGKPHT